MSLSARNWAWDVGTLGGHPLKPGAKLVLLCLAEMESIADACAYPSQTTISQRTGIAERTVRAHLRLLEEAGAFTIERRRSTKGRWLHSVYVLAVPGEYRRSDERWMATWGETS